jgi:hypothetical protein
VRRGAKALFFQATMLALAATRKNMFNECVRARC